MLVFPCALLLLSEYHKSPTLQLSFVHQSSDSSLFQLFHSILTANFEANFKKSAFRSEKLSLAEAGRRRILQTPTSLQVLHSLRLISFQPCCLMPHQNDKPHIINHNCQLSSLHRVSGIIPTSASSPPASPMSASNLAPLKLVVTNNSSSGDKSSTRDNFGSSSGSNFQVSEAGCSLRAGQRIEPWHSQHANLHMNEDPHDLYLGDIYARINRPFDCFLSTQAETELVLFLQFWRSIPDIADQLQRNDGSIP